LAEAITETELRPTGFFKIVVVRGTSPGSNCYIGATAVAAGSSKGLLLFPDDPFISPLQATFQYRDGHLYVCDEGGLSGTFVRIKGPERLSSGSQFALGEHLVLFTGPLVPPPPCDPVPYGSPVPPGTLYSLEVLHEGVRPGRTIVHAGPVVSIGRTGCDLSIPNDSTISARHCEVSLGEAGALLTDLNSSEGTYIRLAPGAERCLGVGDMVRFGLHVLRIEAA